MVWFKTDDRHHAHKKTRRVLRSHPTKRRDAGAMGLWHLCGTWSSHNGTDGWIPADQLDNYDDDWEAQAARLVDAGYWIPDEVDGEPGYWMHDFADYNPTSAKTAERHVERSESGLRGNHIRHHVNKGVEALDCSLCMNTRSEQVASRYSEDSATRYSDGVRSLSESPVPSRPVPIPSSDARDAMTHQPVDNSGLTDDDLDKIASHTNGDRDHASRVARQILDRASESPRKPLAYVLRAIASDPERYRRRARVTKATECATHPGQSATSCAACAVDDLDPRPVPPTQVKSRRKDTP